MLLLRQACQPYLDAFALNDLHVGIYDKTLTIVGPCGKTILFISGIKFSKSTVSAEERAYATQLFDAFMQKHSKDLVDYIVAKKEFSKLEEPSLPQDAVSKNTYNLKLRSITFVTPWIDESKRQNFTMYEDGSLSITNSIPNLGYLESIVQIVKDLQEDVATYFANFDKYMERNKKLEQLQNQLSKCSI